MNVHIAPIGTSTDEHIRRAIQRYPVDKLYLIPTRESLEKAKSLKADLKKAHPFIDIEIKTFAEGEGKVSYVDPFNLNDIVRAISEIAKEESGNNLFINITGGTKLMAGAATATSYVVGATAYYVKEPIKEDEGKEVMELIIELPVPKVPILGRKKKEVKLKF